MSFTVYRHSRFDGVHGSLNAPLRTDAGVSLADRFSFVSSSLSLYGGSGSDLVTKLTMSETQLISFRVQAGQRCVVSWIIQEVAENDTFHKSLEQLVSLLKDRGDDEKLRNVNLTSSRVFVSPSGSSTYFSRE